MPTTTDPREVPDDLGPISAATAERIATLGGQGSPLAELALALAARIDTGQEPGSALASLSRQLRDTLTDLQAEVPPDEHEFDPIAALKARYEGLQAEPRFRR